MIFVPESNECKVVVDWRWRKYQLSDDEMTGGNDAPSKDLSKDLSKKSLVCMVLVAVSVKHLS